MRPPQDRRNNRPNNQRRNGNQNRVPVHVRQFDSSGPSGKLRGTAKQLIDKYMGLSRDYYTSGDDVKAETCKQFAEHYSRLIGNFYNNRNQTNNPNQNTPPEKKEIEKVEEKAPNAHVAPTVKPENKIIEKRVEVGVQVKKEEKAPNARVAPTVKPENKTAEKRVEVEIQAKKEEVKIKDEKDVIVEVKKETVKKVKIASKETKEAVDKPKKRGRPRKIDAAPKIKPEIAEKPQKIVGEEIIE